MSSDILIDSDNISVSVKEKFKSTNTISFEFPNNDYKTIDEYISKEIIEELIDKDFNIIYIKDNLSLNYLELYGLRVAYHIRLSQELGNKRFVPIVILSDLDIASLNKLESMARILFTKNVFLGSNSVQTMDKYNHKTFQEFNEKSYKKEFLDLITIESPENSTNHSIANKWAIYKWAHELQMYHLSFRKEINKTLEEISHSLYIKYLKMKNDINELAEIEIKKLSKYTKKTKELLNNIENFDGNVLYIDDEYSKGWGDIFKYCFSLSKAKDKIYILDFKDLKTYDAIVKKVESECKELKIDLIILDLRLIQSDHLKQTKPNKISGIRLLNKIKSTELGTNFNPGIQVVVLSATTRSDILEQAYKDNKISGYIQKDHIDNQTISTEKNIHKLLDFIFEVPKNFYLKEVWELQKSILILDIFKKEAYNSIQTEIEFIFELLNSNMENRFKFSMLTIYKVLEIVKDLYVNDNAKYIVDCEEIKAICLVSGNYLAVEKIKFLGIPSNYGFFDSKNKTAKQNANKYYYSTTNKLCSVMFEKLGIHNDKSFYERLMNISDKRNNYIHPTKRKNLNIDKDDILDWFRMLNQVLEKMNEKEST